MDSSSRDHAPSTCGAVRVERIGDATLYLGDCRDILPTLGRVDAVVTDPPYGVGLTAKTSFWDTKSGEAVQASVTYSDEPEAVAALIREAIPVALGLAERAAIFSGHRMLQHYPMWRSMGSAFVGGASGRDPWGFGCTNPILYYGKDPYLATGQGSRPNSFSDSANNPEKFDHPCPKPVKWMLWLVNRASLPGETILDPFMGSGTTGVACANLGRAFIGIEREPAYFEIACRRIAEAYRQPRLFEEPPPKPTQGSMFGDAA
jgi:site-specific DNA-methyltransferase (adenine-specific)